MTSKIEKLERLQQSFVSQLGELCQKTKQAYQKIKDEEVEENESV